MQSNHYGGFESTSSGCTGSDIDTDKIKFGHQIHPAILANIRLDESRGQNNCNSIVINDESNLGAAWTSSSSSGLRASERDRYAHLAGRAPRECRPLASHSTMNHKQTNKSQQLEGFLNEQINLNDDDKSTLSILLNEFESNSCDLSELLNNLLQHVLAKMTNPMSKHRLLSLIKSIYIEPLIEAATQDGQPDDTCESINGRRLSMNSAGKLQLDLRLFEAMIQRYLIASRVLQADESMLFNPIKPSCRPDDYYLPSSQAAIKLESTTTTTRETNDNRHPSENLITSPAIQTTNSNNNNYNNLASPVSLNLANQTGRHLSQNVTPMELPEIGIECARNAGRRSPVAPKQQQLARRNLSWLESRHNNHDHLHGGHQTTAEGLPLQFSAHHLGPANSGLDTNQLEAIYLNDDDDDDDDDDDEHLEDFMLVAPTETNKPNNNNNFVSIKNQQDKHDKDYLLPIQQQQQQQQRAAQSSPPDVPDMRGREQVNELNLSQPSHLNDNNQAALTVVQRPPYHQHAAFSRYQNNCGGVQGEGERQLECSPSNLVNLANHRAESTISRDFNGLLGAPDEPNHPNHPNQASQRPLDVRHPLGLSASSSSSSLAPVDLLSRPATFASPPDNNHVGQPIEGGNLSSFDQHHNHHHRQRPRQFAGSPSPTQLEPPAAHLDRSWASLESLDRLAQAAYQLDGPPPPPLQDNINSAYLDFNQNNNVIYEPRLAGAPSHPEDYFSYPAGQQQRIRTSSMGGPHANYHNTSSSLDLAALARPQTDDFGRQWQPERDDTPSVCSCLECLGGQARYGPNSGAFLGLAGRNYQGQQQQQLMSHPQHPQHLQQQQQQQQQRCQSSMSMPNSGNWNQANWNEQQQQPPFNTNIPSSHNGGATLLAPSNWAARRPASHLLSNQQVVGGQQTSEPHRHQQQRRPQPQHRSLSSSSGSQLRTYEHEHDHRGQVKSHHHSHHHGHHHRARHRKRHQAARGRQLNYRDEQQRPASGDRTYLDDDDDDDEDDDDDQEDDDGQPTCVSLVPSQAKGRLPMSVAEQMSEQANNFILQHGSGGSSPTRGRRSASGQPQRKPNLQVRRTLRVKIKKSKPILGIAIEGGFNVSGQLLPRIVCVHEEGAAYQCGKLRASDLILEINGISTVNMTHDDIARTIATAYYQDERPYIEFLIGESVHV